MSRLHYLANQMKRNRYASGGRIRPYEPVWSTNQLSQMGQNEDPEGYSDLIEKYHTPGEAPYKYNAPLPPLSPSFEEQTKQAMKREADTMGERLLTSHDTYGRNMHSMLDDIRARNPELADEMDVRYKPTIDKEFTSPSLARLRNRQLLEQDKYDNVIAEQQAIAAKQRQDEIHPMQNQITDLGNQLRQMTIERDAALNNYTNANNLLGTTQKDLENQKLEVQKLQGLPKGFDQAYVNQKVQQARNEVAQQYSGYVPPDTMTSRERAIQDILNSYSAYRGGCTGEDSVQKMRAYFKF